MDVRRLELLLALSRHGSMHAVSDLLGVTTSTVSQQIAALAKEVGTALIEPDGRRVRLTPAGRRLAGHAVHIIAAHEAARADLDPSAQPAGTVRIAAFHTAIRDTLLPVVPRLPSAVRLEIQEQEPPDAIALLDRDQVDLALIYDYNLAPAHLDPALQATPLWENSWSLAVPSRSPRRSGTAIDVVAAFADSDWIVNSRHVADEQVLRTIGALAGFDPRITHRADSLTLVQEMISAGLGVALMPAAYPKTTGISLRRLRDPEPRMRAHAVVRRGRTNWPPLALVAGLLSPA